MKIRTAAENEAILSNVGEIGEFRIRNSAKAFGILSSGLYANKIRAIIREYSCNAYDSHVEAGRAHCPFEVHLPNSLDTYFSVRDFGVGLDHEQVVNIFTTYFESTKTATDDLIGGLGLGSKSAFSYTDNFTITAIKNGVKRIYTAFINDHGVPSVALMMQEDTDEAPGVEIRFAVTDSYDFRKFRDEASTVFTYFPVRPNVTGVDNFEVRSHEYETENLIPGVNVFRSSRYSYAIMGNIAYPIQVPNVQENFGDLARLLDCGLEIRFGIGELDIQASREGLSYIPETIAAIKAKLQAVNDRLETFVAEEVDKVEGAWQKAMFIAEKSRKDLYQSAVLQYFGNHPELLVDKQSYYSYLRTKELFVKTDQLKSWNIQISAFTSSPYRDVKRVIKESSHYENGGTVPGWEFQISDNKYFVESDIKRGELQRAKYHWSNDTKAKASECYVYVLTPIDREKAMDTAAFYAAIHNPPNQMLASALLERVIEKREKVVRPDPSVLKLQKRNFGGYAWRQRDNELVWRDAGSLKNLDATATYYYVPVKGFTDQLEKVTCGADVLMAKCINSGLPELAGIDLYGVRKADIETVQALPNWINIEEHIDSVLDNISDDTVNKIAFKNHNAGHFFGRNEGIVSRVTAGSPYLQVVNSIVVDETTKIDQHTVDSLLRLFKKDVEAFHNRIKDCTAELRAMVDRYPLLADLNRYANEKNVADYINMVDSVHNKD